MSTQTLSAILVHVDGTPGAPRRVAAAGALADAFNARLIGLAGGQFVIPVYAPFGEGFVAIQPEVIEAARAQVRQQLNAAEKTFRAAAGARSAIEWRSNDAADSADYLSHHARAADIVVVGRAAKDEPADPQLGVAVSDIVMTAGRSVLVLPPGVERISAKRIVVAWKDTRESRRATREALPLFRAAEEVFVAGIGDEVAATSVEDTVAYLVGHGVPAKAVIEAKAEGRPAAALLRVAQRVNADLIVSGAFGHSRMREWAFGGVTRDLLDQATIAVLFSH